MKLGTYQANAAFKSVQQGFTLLEVLIAITIFSVLDRKSVV